MLTSLLDKYVRKSPVLSYSPLVKEGSKKVDWKNKPSDWSDIRKDCPKNSIALYAAHPSNFSQYDNLGFTATCTGGYNVFIDGVQYHAKNLITNDIDGQGTYISPSYTTTTRIHKSLANIPLGTYTLTITGNFYFIMQKKIENVGENIGSWETSATYTFDDATATYGIAIRKADNSNITPSEFDGTLQLENGSTATAYEPYGLFASGTQCNITWSTSGITTGDDITTPSAMKAHKIWIEPATEGNDITKFCCQRVAASGYEEQGVLWAHFNLTNTINLNTGLADDYSHHNNLMKACTAKNNVIKISGLNSCFHNMQKLEYVPTFDGDNNIVDLYASFYLCLSLEKINFKNTRFRIGANTFNNAQALKKLPKLDYSSATEMQTFLETNTSLEDTVLDVRDATGLKVIQCRGWSGGFMSGFKGLRASNEAPFDGSSPQINVSYTGMDRQALVTLFNDLPYNVGYEVVGSPTINNGVISGFSDNDYLNLSVLPNTLRDFDFVIKIKDLGSSLFRPILSAQGTNFQCFVSNGGGIGFSIGGNSYYNWSVPPSTGWVFLRYLIKNNKVSIGQSTNGIDWSMSSPEEITNPFNNFTNNASLGSSDTLSSVSVDLNNTYIKVNDVYWFRGQPAMTKTLNCVGCTGTADLTQDDKDIALNKGWSITIS